MFDSYKEKPKNINFTFFKYFRLAGEYFLYYEN